MKIMKLSTLSTLSTLCTLCTLYSLVFNWSCSNGDIQTIRTNAKRGDGNAQAACPTDTKKSLFLAAAPTYQGNIKAIMDAKCVGCHNPTTGLKKTPFLNTYETVKASSSKDIARMEAGTMPPAASPRLAAGDLTLFKDWASAGFPLAPTTAAVPAVPAVAKVVYVGEIDKLLKNSCTNCHKPGMTLPDLSTFDTAKAKASAALTEMQAGTMPTTGKMQQASIDKFKKWIDDGAMLDLVSDENNASTKTATPAIPSSGECL